MPSRRQSIVLSAETVATLLALGPVLGGIARASAGSDRRLPPSTGIDWSTFLADLEALTQAQHRAGWDPDRHVERVAALMGELDVSDATLETLLDQHTPTRRGRPSVRSVHDGGDHEVVVLQFEPGERLGLHNHPRMTGVILCITGSVHLEAHNLLAPGPQTGDLRLQRVEDRVLHPGDHAILTPAHGNIHALEAREWCELLDVFTPPYTPDRLRDYRQYVRSAAPIQGEDIFRARET